MQIRPLNCQISTNGHYRRIRRSQIYFGTNFCANPRRIKEVTNFIQKPVFRRYPRLFLKQIRPPERPNFENGHHHRIRRSRLYFGTNFHENWN